MIRISRFKFIGQSFIYCRKDLDRSADSSQKQQDATFLTRRSTKSLVKYAMANVNDGGAESM